MPTCLTHGMGVLLSHITASACQFSLLCPDLPGGDAMRPSPAARERAQKQLIQRATKPTFL